MTVCATKMVRDIRWLSGAETRELAGIALLRLDFNTEDEWRMEAAVPTVKFLMRHAKKVVIVSHKGRPKGRDLKFGLSKSARDLSRLISHPVKFISSLNFAEVKKEISNNPGQRIFLLENLRFDSGEDKNSHVFAKKLASLADYYVNDAFAFSHRRAASIVAITKFLPSFGGFIFEKEFDYLSGFKNPKHPFVVVIGGAKASDKLAMIKYFYDSADRFLLGGGSGNTMLMLRGEKMGSSLMESDKGVLRQLKKYVDDPKVVTPTDSIVYHGACLDIGLKTREKYSEILGRAKTILWAGPMGLIERSSYAHGSLAVARAITANRKATSVTGGGETVMLLRKHGLDKKFSYISTGGGAMIEFLSGEKLPGVTALEECRIKIKKI